MARPPCETHPCFYDVSSERNKVLMSLTNIYLVVVKFLHIFNKLKYGSRGKKAMYGDQHYVGK
jgi:hypothetical protein